MPLPLTVSCSNKIQIGFTFLVPAHPGSPGKRAVKRVCVCVRMLILSFSRPAHGADDIAQQLRMDISPQLCLQWPRARADFKRLHHKINAVVRWCEHKLQVGNTEKIMQQLAELLNC